MTQATQIENNLDFIIPFVDLMNKICIEIVSYQPNFSGWLIEKQIETYGIIYNSITTNTENKKHLTTLKCDEQFPFTNNFADLIILPDSIQRIPCQMNYFILECQRILKPGGQLFIIQQLPKECSYSEVEKLYRKITPIIDIKAKIQQTNSNFELITNRVFYMNMGIRDFKRKLKEANPKQLNLKFIETQGRNLFYEFAKQENRKFEKFRFKDFYQLHIFRLK